MRAHYAVYHNHKEVSAWAGVVLYVIFATQIAFASDEMFESDAVVYAAWMLSCAFFLAILVYLHTQFRLRHEAANYVAAFLYLHVEYLAKVETEINEADWLVEPRPDTGHQSPQFLPKQVLNKALDMDRVGHSDRRKLEVAAYTIVVVTFLAGVLRLWLL
jgi:hypothetical protein